MGWGSGVAISWGVGCRLGSDPKLLWLWLWLWLAGTALIPLIRPLAWEPPYASDAALERQNTKKKKGLAILIIHPYSVLENAEKAIKALLK